MVSGVIETAMNQESNWGKASALGGVLLVATLILFAVYNRLVGIDKVRFRMKRPMLKPAPYATPAERVLFYAGWTFTLLVLLFLMAPILTVMPLSFNAEPYFSYPMPGLSLQWYVDFFTNPRWTGALALSVKLAVV